MLEAKEIREKKIPPDIRNLLSSAKAVLAAYGKLEMLGYEFDPSAGLKPFYGLYPKSSISPLMTVLKDDGGQLKLTLSHRLSPDERKNITYFAQEFSRQHGYALSP